MSDDQVIDTLRRDIAVLTKLVEDLTARVAALEQA